MPRRPNRPWQFGSAIGAVLVLAVTVSPNASSETAANTRFSTNPTVALPGRGLSIAWSPDGTELAVGGHFREKTTGLRYDTRALDVGSRTLTKSFACHLWWTIAHTWSNNPYLGEVIVDGGGDHAVKIWNANGPGATTCKPGQMNEADGGIKTLYNINGWVTSLAFSPDGKWLAGTSRDRTVRIWQIAPGPDQWKVVRLWYDKTAGQFLSVRWSPDGTRLITGDREGRVAEWSWHPFRDRWSPEAIAAFAKRGWSGHPQFYNGNLPLVTRTPLWMEDGHKAVWNVRYSPDGNRVAAVGTDGWLSVYQARTGAVIYRTLPPDQGQEGKRRPKHVELHGLDWSPDGALLAVGAKNDTIYIFNASEGTLYDKLVGHAELVSAVAWSPNGKVLASTAGGQRVSEGLNQVSQGPDNAVHFWTRR
jgi:WD40 repeat protein